MMSVSTLNKSLNTEIQKSAAREFAFMMCSFKECSNDVQEVILAMAQIVTDPDADEHEKEMALATIQEALFPGNVNGQFGADLLELEELEAQDPSTASISAELDAEEATFADRVQALMEKRQLTQKDLAERAGVGQPAISMMLNRKCRPQSRTIARLAEALGVSVSDLWPGK